MGPFESFYASELQHPWLLWAAALLAGIYVAWRPNLKPALRRYGLALVALSLADAWLTSAQVYGLGAWSGRAASLVPLFFVLAGDFRFLLLVEAASADGGLRPGFPRVLAALGLTLIVPISSQAVLAMLPEAWGGARVLFLTYELAFFMLTLVLLRVRPNLRPGAWLRPVGTFVLIYYGLWASADALLLASGADVAFGLRVLPNLLYYGGLIAMIAYAASRSSDPDGDFKGAAGASIRL